MGRGVAGVGRYIEAAAFRLVGAKQTEQHVVGRGVLRVALVAGALEPLGGVALAIGEANLITLIGDRQSVDGQATVGVPVAQEIGSHGVAVHGATAGLGRAAGCGHCHHTEHEGDEREPEDAGILLQGL